MKKIIFAVAIMSMPNLVFAATCKDFAEKQAYVLLGSSQQIGAISKAEVTTSLNNESQMDSQAQWTVNFNWSDDDLESAIIYTIDTRGTDENSCSLVSVSVLEAG